MVVFEGVSKSFIDGKDKNIILDKTSVKMQSGKKIALVGRSGLGKSTVLKMILGIEKVDEGCIKIENVSITDYKEIDFLELRRKTIGCIFQNFNLIPNLTVKENIMLPTYFYDNRVDINGILEKVDLPKSILEKSINFLSGGEKQRVAIARALINSPKLLVADEPTGNLDFKNEEKIVELFKRINKEFLISILVVTHSEFVTNNMDQVYTIKNGKIILNEEYKDDSNY